MEAQDAIDIGRQAVMVGLLVGAPILVIGMVIGLAIGLFQALTQIQDQTIAFVPKIVAMVAALGICLPWMIRVMADYTDEMIRNVPTNLWGG